MTSHTFSRAAAKHAIVLLACAAALCGLEQTSRADSLFLITSECELYTVDVTNLSLSTTHQVRERLNLPDPVSPDIGCIGLIYKDGYFYTFYDRPRKLIRFGLTPGDATVIGTISSNATLPNSMTVAPNGDIWVATSEYDTSSDPFAAGTPKGAIRTFNLTSLAFGTASYPNPVPYDYNRPWIAVGITFDSAGKAIVQSSWDVIIRYENMNASADWYPHPTVCCSQNSSYWNLGTTNGLVTSSSGQIYGISGLNQKSAIAVLNLVAVTPNSYSGDTVMDRNSYFVLNGKVARGGAFGPNATPLSAYPIRG